jgi:hypothetical protein
MDLQVLPAESEDESGGNAFGEVLGQTLGDGVLDEPDDKQKKR